MLGSARRSTFALGLFIASCDVVRAHAVDGVPMLATAWSLSPIYLWPPIVLAIVYAFGVARLWRRAGVGRGISLIEASSFAMGLVMLFLAVVWPLDAFGEWSFGAHMAQHMVLLAAVPPLILSGQPMAAAAQALPRPWLQPLHRFGSRTHGRLLAALALATLAHSGVMWVWHLPAATMAALDHEGIHVLMHGSFLIAGMWFWSALLRCMREPVIGVGSALIALVAVMMQMGLLGALLTFAPRVLYPVYAVRAPRIGLDPLVDQQLAGLIMWVPACLPYLIGAIWLLKHSFDRASPAIEQRERAAMRGSSSHTVRSP
jgi:putative membrane protein